MVGNLKDLRFAKWHGLGNDYILVDIVTNKYDISDPGELAHRMSRRNFSVGSDGILMICPSDKADFKMRIFNPDGSEAEMCGNGIRIVAKYIHDKGLSDKKQLEIETLAGIIKPEVLDNGHVRVDMGEPILDREKVPMKGNPGQVVNEPLDLDDQIVNITAVSMGNPHAVIFVDSFNFSVKQLGKEIENHEAFPNRTNVEFVQPVNENELSMVVWERGAGVTLACGTGASAAAVAAVLNKKAARKVTVHLVGGDLQVEWNEQDNHVYIEGPAVEVYEATYKDPQ